MTVATLSKVKFLADPSEALDLALERHVVVEDGGQPHHVVLSYDEYRRLTELERVAFLVEELDEQALDEIANAKMELGHEHLDAELGLERR